MAKKFILHGMGIEKGRLMDLMWGVVLLCSLFISPINAQAQTCTIDYNRPTIAAGENHTVALKEDGTVVATGNNYFGETNVNDWTNIKAVAAGFSHTVGLKEDGTVVAVGNNSEGQINVSSWTNIKAIAAGGEHTAGLREDGTVVRVGAIRGVAPDVSTWSNIKAIAAGYRLLVGLKEDGTIVATGTVRGGVPYWTNIKAIAASEENIIGLRADGTVVHNVPQWFPTDWTNMKAIAAGLDHFVGLREDGTVVAVWSNDYGQGNVSSWTDMRAIAAGPYSTVGLKGDGTVIAVGLAIRNSLPTDDSNWGNIKSVATGAFHTLGLKGNGSVVVKSSGFDYSGRPLACVNTADWSNIKSVAAGAGHSVGLKEDGTVVAVGDNGYGQLNVSSWANIKAIAANSYHTVGLKEDGTVVAVGAIWYGYGQLNVSSWTNIKAIAAGPSSVFGIKEDGTVVAVGDNWYGNLNVSSWANIKAIAANSYHTAGLKEDGTVVAVGYSWYSNLNVSSWTNIKAIATTSSATFGLKEDGTVVGIGSLGQWGYNKAQQMVSAWTNIKAIAAGPSSVFGIKEDGTVVSAGDNNGQMPGSYWTNIRHPSCSVVQPPTFLTASDIPCDNGGGISLNWALSPDDPALGSGGNEVSGYNIYRSDTSGGTYSHLSSVSAGVESYTDNTATAETTYYYIVRATNGVNESADSNEALATSIRNLPASPGNLTALDTPYDLGGSITLFWAKSADDGAGLNNVSAYNIYRYSAANGSIATLASIPAGTTGYLDNTPVDADTYYYFIKAYNSQCNAESEASNIATGQSVNNFSSLPGYIGALPGIAPEILTSLTSKVDNALFSFENGNVKAAANQLNALLNEISAQSGKKIATDAADLLITYIQNLMNYIN